MGAADFLRSRLKKFSGLEGREFVEYGCKSYKRWQFLSDKIFQFIKPKYNAI